MAKPLIGVAPLFDEKRQRVWMLPGYMRGIEAAGGLPVILSMTADEEALAQWAKNLDGFLFTGGQDVDPALYGEEKLPKSGEACAGKDRLEGILLNHILRLNKPALGICRGLQFMNAHLGGTLYQDIPSQMKDAIAHNQPPPYEETSHEAAIFKDSPLYAWLGKEKINVNSLHHQGIKKLAGGLRIAAASPDGLPEAAWMPDKKFIFGVQWHPEYNFENDADSHTLFNVFIRAALSEYNGNIFAVL
jgi:putative glutamine amidotransferase